jgi:hypothetical protein
MEVATILAAAFVRKVYDAGKLTLNRIFAALTLLIRQQTAIAVMFSIVPMWVNFTPQGHVLPNGVCLREAIDNGECPNPHTSSPKRYVTAEVTYDKKDDHVMIINGERIRFDVRVNKYVPAVAKDCAGYVLNTRGDLHAQVYVPDAAMLIYTNDHIIEKLRIKLPRGIPDQRITDLLTIGTLLVYDRNQHTESGFAEDNGHVELVISVNPRYRTIHLMSTGGFGAQPYSQFNKPEMRTISYDEIPEVVIISTRPVS